MEKIFFPASYRNALLKKTKTITVRVDKELGKYKTGRTYRAFSYGGADWGIRIRISEIHNITIGGLKSFGVTERSVESLKKQYAKKDDDPVELIKFTYPI